MIRYIALLRGINVGRHRRIAMAELRRMMEGLGYGDVLTLLNSGNVVFTARTGSVAGIAAAIESGIEANFGFSTLAVVLPADEFSEILEENPLRAVANDASRLLVAFVSSPTLLATCRSLPSEPWAPEMFVLGSKAAFLWCARGVRDSPLMQTFMRRTGDTATTRNWATVLKLNEAAGKSC